MPSKISALLFLLLAALLPLISAQRGGGRPTSSSTTETTTTSSTTFSSSSSTTTTTTTSTSTSTAPTSSATGQFGACVNNCMTTNPVVSKCKGTETGTALDQCTCNSYTPTDDPTIGCIYSCPSDQQLQFAQSLPSLCAQTLFLGLNLTDQPKPTAENTVASASRDVPSTPSPTAGAGATAGAASSTSGNGNGAGRVQAMVGTSGFVVVCALGMAVLL